VEYAGARHAVQTDPEAAEMLRQVNKALAEYYGEVLPDCPEAAPKRAKSTEVAKDLQFYRTPAAVADQLVKQACPREGFRVLEPSCGDGAILDALRRFAIEGRVDFSAQGVEVHPGRAEEARAKRHHVQIANFLQVAPSPVFDLVLMNPPFYGKHYQQHVEHGRKFLKPNGRLLAILPISAVTDHGYITGDLRGWDRWRDLPVGSFSESGTNINTGIATFGAP
jgi:predicted RNA methylase